MLELFKDHDRCRWGDSNPQPVAEGGERVVIVPKFSPAGAHSGESSAGRVSLILTVEGKVAQRGPQPRRWTARRLPLLAYQAIGKSQTFGRLFVCISGCPPVSRYSAVCSRAFPNLGTVGSLCL
jgi:hypothetical protein